MKRITEDKSVLIFNSKELAHMISLTYGIHVGDIHNIHINDETKEITIILIKSITDEVKTKSITRDYTEDPNHRMGM